MIRPRATHMLLLILGLILSIAIFALAMSKLSHLAPARAPTSSGAQHPDRTAAVAHSAHHGWLTFAHGLVILGVSAALGLAALARWAIRIVRERLENRLTRQYGLYELRLSLHDEAREQDVVDMVEALLHAVREFPEDRTREGQPFVALEAHYGPGSSGEPEWMLCVRCERALAETIDGIIAAAYPDVRLGYEFIGPPREIGGVLREPGHVLRFRKSRSFLYPIVKPGSAWRRAPAGSDRASTGRRRCPQHRALPADPVRAHGRALRPRAAARPRGTTRDGRRWRSRLAEQCGDGRRRREPGSRVVLA